MKRFFLTLILCSFASTALAQVTQRFQNVVVSGTLAVSGNVTMPSFTVTLNQDAATGVTVNNNFNTANAQVFLGLQNVGQNVYWALVPSNWGSYHPGSARITGSNTSFDIESDAALNFFTGGWDDAHKRGGFINSGGFYLGTGVPTANVKVFKRYTIAGQLQEQLYNDSDSPSAYAEYLIKSGTTQPTNVYFGSQGGLSSDPFGFGRGYLLANSTNTTQPGLDIYSCSASSPANCTIRFVTNGSTTAQVRSTLDANGFLMDNGGLYRTNGTLGASGGSQNLLSFGTAQLSSTEKFQLTFGAATNAGDGSRADIAAAFGWNVQGDGSTPLVAGEPAIMWRFENYYRPAATACNTSTHGCQEAHLQWLASDGTVFRPIGIQTIDNTKNVALAFNGDTSFLSADGGTQYFKMSGGSMTIFNSSALLGGVNNATYLKMLNQAGTRFNNLAYISNIDDVVLGDNAANGTKHLFLLSSTGAQIRTLQTNALGCNTNCGTSASVTGSDTSGRITMGATGAPASGFVVTFGDTWGGSTVACNVWMSKSGMVVGKMPIVVVSTTTQFTVTTNGTAPANSDTYDYRCTSN